MHTNERQPAVKDEEREHPVADAWRPTLRAVVRALASEDYALARGIPLVATPTQATSDQMRAYVASYGERIADLPDETWDSSVAQWTGTQWHVHVDLWTVESGSSDLVLDVRVIETDDGFRFEVGPLYVP
jgi:hypothetical protein